jgi:glycosyltransferase involved in cell wall biosynthesis
MDNSIVLTVGIPVFNAEKYLRIAIESVLNQSFSDFELIISDDGSTDNSFAIIQSFNDSRIRILNDGFNRGIGYRLNEQIKYARGIYFARMDADDIMFPNRLKDQLDFLRLNQNIDVVGTSAVVIDGLNNIQGERAISSNLEFADCVNGSVFLHPTIMGKTSWFRKYTYDNGLSGTEDYDLFMRSFRFSKFHNLNTPGLFYRDTNNVRFKTYLHRQHEIILTLNKNRNLIQDRFLVLKSKFRLFLKCLIFFVIVISKQYSFFIKKRNSPIPPILLKEYYRILQTQLNKFKH